MADVRADPLPPIPDNLTVPQFFLDTHDPVRPVNKGLHPWLIEDATGRQIGFEEVRVKVASPQLSLTDKL